jgi:hypothetical protein
LFRYYLYLLRLQVNENAQKLYTKEHVDTFFY